MKKSTYSEEQIVRVLRDECLAMEWFRNRIEAKIVIEDWRIHYNEVRPHSSLQYATPAEFRRGCEISSTTGATNL